MEDVETHLVPTVVHATVDTKKTRIQIYASVRAYKMSTVHCAIKVQCLLLLRVLILTCYLSLSLSLSLDVNECQRGLHGCDGLCRDTDGSYECSCPHGLKLDADQHSCIGMFICCSITWYFLQQSSLYLLCTIEAILYSHTIGYIIQLLCKPLCDIGVSLSYYI